MSPLGYVFIGNRYITISSFYRNFLGTDYDVDIPTRVHLISAIFGNRPLFLQVVGNFPLEPANGGKWSCEIFHCFGQMKCMCKTVKLCTGLCMLYMLNQAKVATANNITRLVSRGKDLSELHAWPSTRRNIGTRISVWRDLWHYINAVFCFT